MGTSALTHDRWRSATSSHYLVKARRRGKCYRSHLFPFRTPHELYSASRPPLLQSVTAAPDNAGRGQTFPTKGGRTEQRRGDMKRRHSSSAVLAIVAFGPF